MSNPSQLPHAHIDGYVDPARLEEFAAMLKTVLGDKMTSVSIAYKEITVSVPKANILKVLRLLRDDKNCQFKLFVSLCGVDTPEREAQEPPRPRFDVVYHLLSLTQNMRVRVKVVVGEGESVPSAVPIYSAANWYERETYDMYGILFDGHPDLRRLLTDYDFEGHPLRKDFPLNGHVEVYYDEKEKRVAYKPVDLPQPLRHFDIQSPWSEAITNSTSRADDETFKAEDFK